MSATRRAGGPPRPVPSAPETIRRRSRAEPPAAGRALVFLAGLEIMASIGVHPHEHGRTQRVLVDVELDLGSLPPPAEDRLAETVDYEAIARGIEAIARGGHVQLVETLAERIAAWCLVDPRVRSARVRIEKPEALPNARAAGCEVLRARG